MGENWKTYGRFTSPQLTVLKKKAHTPRITFFKDMNYPSRSRWLGPSWVSVNRARVRLAHDHDQATDFNTSWAGFNSSLFYHWLNLAPVLVMTWVKLTPTPYNQLSCRRHNFLAVYFRRDRTHFPCSLSARGLEPPCIHLQIQRWMFASAFSMRRRSEKRAAETKFERFGLQISTNRKL